MNWLFIVVIGIILLGGAIGYCKGLIQMAFSIVAIVLAITLTAILTPGVTKAVEGNEKIYGTIYDIVENNIDITDEVKETNEIKKTEDEVKEYQEKAIESLNIPQSLKNAINESNIAEEYEKFNAQNFEQYVYSYITSVIINSIVYVVVFVLVSVILTVIVNLLNIFGRLPVINGINKLSGMAVGFVVGLIIVYLLFIVLMIFSNTKLGNNAMECVNENSILSVIYEQNPIWKWLLEHM